MTQPAFIADPTLPAPIPRQAIRQFIETISRLQAQYSTSKQRQKGQRVAGGEQAWIWLKISNYRGLGVDEYRTANDPTSGLLDARVCGQRSFVLTVDAWSLDSQLRAYDIEERVRLGMRTTYAANFYVTNGIAHVRTETSLRQFADSDNREVSRAVMDVTFAMAVNMTPANDDGGVIQTVDGSNQLPPNAPNIPGTVTT